MSDDLGGSIIYYKPEAPTNVTDDEDYRSTTRIYIEFVPVDEEDWNGSDVNEYELYRLQEKEDEADEDVWVYMKSSNSDFFDLDRYIAACTDYTFVVTAMNGYGESDYSEQYEIVSGSAPDAPLGVTYAQVAGEMTVTVDMSYADEDAYIGAFGNCDLLYLGAYEDDLRDDAEDSHFEVGQGDYALADYTNGDDGEIVFSAEAPFITGNDTKSDQDWAQPSIGLITPFSLRVTFEDLNWATDEDYEEYYQTLIELGDGFADDIEAAFDYGEFTLSFNDTNFHSGASDCDLTTWGWELTLIAASDSAETVTTGASTNTTGSITFSGPNGDDATVRIWGINCAGTADGVNPYATSLLALDDDDSNDSDDVVQSNATWNGTIEYVP